MEVTEWFEKQWNLIIQRFGHEAGDHHIGLSRLNKMFDILTGKTLPQFEHKAQKPYTFYLPGLPATPFHDPASFPFCSILEQNSPIIRQELLALIHQQEGQHSTLNTHLNERTQTQTQTTKKLNPCSIITQKKNK